MPNNSSKNKVPLPKTQKELESVNRQAYDRNGLPPSSSKNKAHNRRVDDSNVNTLNIGLKDIDETIVYYFNNVIKPSVIQNGSRISVPTIYGSPERWTAVQRDGFYRDKNGKIMLPLIMFKRDSIQKNRNLGNKLDANNPTNFGIFEKRYSKKNVYDRFSILTNRRPVREFYGVVIPDYINLTYTCIIFTDYIEQMNKIVESINYASDSYWGEPERFKFRAMIDNYTTVVELNKGQDRGVKTNFTINMFGHIIPDSINTELLGSRKFFSTSKVMFKLETVENYNDLILRSNTPERESPRRFYDTLDSSVRDLDNPLSAEEILFTSTNTTSVANLVTSNFAVFNNKTILTSPPGYTLNEDSFTVYINGISLPSPYVLVQQSGSNIVTTFTTASLDYEIEPTDTVILTGKYT